MKKWLLLVLLCMFGEFALGAVTVHDVNVSNISLPSEIIKGEINLTISEADYDAKIESNNDDEIGLIDFLEFNSADFGCSPSGCMNGYEPLGNIAGETFSVPSSGEKTIGFVLYGDSVVLTGLSFSIESDFDESYRMPLIIKFFEEELWKFNEFSTTFLPKDWGCYDKVSRTTGDRRIGDSLYCELINIPNSGGLRVGADVSISNDETSDLTMSVYSENSVGGTFGTCDFNPSLGEEGCFINEDSSVGDYYVCISAAGDTDYYIYEESVGENCGFVGPSSQTESVKDYGIFVQSLKYADSSWLEWNEFNNGDLNEELLDIANEIIEGRYDKDCSEGCVLPLVFSGVSQNVSISDIALAYKEGGELGDDEDCIYELNVSSVMINFDGVLDLEMLGFSVSKSMDYIVKLGGEELFGKVMEILLVPEIFSVSPLNPPAGVPIQFYAKVNFNDNSSLSYKWDFGDGKVVTTSEPSISHSYANLGNYTLNLEVGAGLGLTSKRSFEIEAISPRAAVDINLVSKRNALNKINSSFSNFTFWYKDALLNIVNATFFYDELDRLDEAKESAASDQNFVDIAKYLYTLNIPTRINIEDYHSSYLITEAEDVNVEAVVIAGGDESEVDSTYYREPILVWQNENIDVSFDKKEFLISLWNGDSNGVFNAYNFDISSRSNEESYFIINMPLSELFFKNDVGAKEAGDATVIVLGSEEDVSFEFYYENEEAISFFISPKLGSILLESAIDTSCNYNLVCEEEYGENSINCRSDCKPVTEAVIYVFLALVFVLIIYTILQVWYKHKYEKYLFKDGRQMYNLLMYVTNARAQGKKDSRIAVILRKRGWSSERVNYIIRKSRGRRTGLVEIIPIEKIAAFSRNRKARNVQAAKVVAKGPLPVGAYNKNIITKNRQQMRRKINKSRFQRRV